MRVRKLTTLTFTHITRGRFGSVCRTSLFKPTPLSSTPLSSTPLVDLTVKKFGPRGVRVPTRVLSVFQVRVWTRVNSVFQHGSNPCSLCTSFTDGIRVPSVFEHGKIPYSNTERTRISAVFQHRLTPCPDTNLSRIPTRNKHVSGHAFLPSSNTG